MPFGNKSDIKDIIVVGSAALSAAAAAGTIKIQSQDKTVHTKVEQATQRILDQAREKHKIYQTAAETSLDSACMLQQAQEFNSRTPSNNWGPLKPSSVAEREIEQLKFRKFIDEQNAVRLQDINSQQQLNLAVAQAALEQGRLDQKGRVAAAVESELDQAAFKSSRDPYRYTNVAERVQQIVQENHALEAAAEAAAQEVANQVINSV